ncbi:unnamed protein product, partial [Rotaria sordida]
CPDSDIKCYSCGLMGHMARDCSNNRIFSSSSSIQPRQMNVSQQSYNINMPLIN